MHKIPVDFKKIEDIRISLWYSNAGKFAKDCTITHPTYLAVKKTHTSGLKFLLWIDSLLVSKWRDPVWIDYFKANAIS